MICIFGRRIGAVGALLRSHEQQIRPEPGKRLSHGEGGAAVREWRAEVTWPFDSIRVGDAATRRREFFTSPKEMVCVHTNLPHQIQPDLKHAPLLQFAHELPLPRGFSALLLLPPPPLLGHYTLRLGPGTLRQSVPDSERGETNAGVDEGGLSICQGSDDG